MKRTRKPIAVTTALTVLAAVTGWSAAATADEPSPSNSDLDGASSAAARLTWPTPRRQPSDSRGQFVRGEPILAEGPGAHLYQVRLLDDPLLGYAGGVPGLRPTAGPSVARTGASEQAVTAYVRHLSNVQRSTVDVAGELIGRPVQPLASMRYGDNMVVLELTAAEAVKVSEVPGVIAVAALPERVPLTDSSPVLINADDVWARDPDAGGALAETRGDGLVIGVIDTGVSPYNPSFAPTPGMENPYGDGNYLGVCADGNWDASWGVFPCNDKLIGMYTWPLDGDGSGVDTPGFDINGHGSHTASTAAGAPVTVDTYGPTMDITGIAPNASIVSYGGCCSGNGLDLVAALDQAALDAFDGLLDVINYSVGSPGAGDPYSDYDAVTFFYIRAEVDTFVATSNSNDGPGYFTVGSPASAPWVTSVAATATERYFLTDVEVVDGSDSLDLSSPVPAVPFGPEQIVRWEPGDNLCNDAVDHTAAYSGKVVVCERGVSPFAEKAEHVAANGGVGMIVVNAGAAMTDPDEAFAIDIPIPGFLISNNAGQALYAFLAGHPAAEVSWVTSLHADDPDREDMIGDFSSRGPNAAVDVVNPSLSAPGVDIMAALAHPGDPTVPVWGAISGTSMASPHVAGAALLLRQLHPDWTSPELQSALMTTAVPTVTDLNSTPADIYTQGSGRLDIERAADAGLLFDVAPTDYVFEPARDLNLPSFADSQCVLTCEWSRVARNLDPAVSWAASVAIEGDPALDVDVSVDDSVPGELVLAVVADVTLLDIGESGDARITLTPDDPTIPEVTMPLGVFAAAAQLPDSLAVDTRRDAGETSFDVASIPVDDFTGTMLGLAEADIVDGELGQDPTFDDAFDVAAGGVAVLPVSVPAGSDRLAVEVLGTTMDDLDLYVGTGTTASNATLECRSATSGSAEFCSIDLPEAGDWWVLVQNWAASGASDTYSVAIGVVPGSDLGNAEDTSPAAPGATEYAVTVAYDVAAQPGSVWYGTLELGSDPANPGDLGYVPFTLYRHADDVTKTASTAQAERLDTVAYTISIAPSISGADVRYDLIDVVPAGLTLVVGSVTGGGVIDGDTIAWNDLLLEGDDADGLTLTYAVTVDADAAPGPYTNEVTHLSDDPGARPEIASATVFVEPPLLQPVPPKRLFDTRPTEPQGAVDVPKHTVGGDDVLTVNLLGVAGIGADGVAAVALNVTAVDPAGHGYVTIFPCGSTRPLVSNVNYTGAPGAYPNAVVVPVAPDGSLCFYSKVHAHLIADVVGWFPEGAGVGTVTPARLFDTRATEPNGSIVVPKSPIGGEGSILRVKVAGVSGVPDTGAAAVALNVTAVDPSGAGYVTVYPCNDTRPFVSNVNYSGPGVYPNAVITPLSADGEVCFYSKVSTHLIADVNAWFPAGSGYGPVTPVRLFDTRATEPDGLITVAKQQYGGDANIVKVKVTGIGGVPADGVGMVSLNVTAVDPTGPGYVTVYPCGPRPVVSNVNFMGPGVYPNAVLTPVSAEGEVCFFAKVPTDLIADVNGWFAAT